MQHQKRADKLFAAALELSPEQRPEFLVEQCAGDVSLLAEVTSLLTFAERAEELDFMHETALDLSAKQVMIDEFAEDRTGQLFGRYKILSLIGEGGMGKVYLAQDTELNRQVALKLIRGNLTTKEARRRFHNERQILAGLQHPNIAQLLDGSSTADGLPFFVMEYVEGQPLNDYADANELSVGQRLKLFRTICAALTYAHQNLVIHRDIKPSNILVTADGTPKLLDFGIAKLLNAVGATAVPEDTATVMEVMTPEYASPEQVKGEHITTASDVYSLGVLLYELLTGSRPYQFKSRKPEDLRNAICEEQPKRPSAVGRRQVAGGRLQETEGDRLVEEVGKGPANDVDSKTNNGRTEHQADRQSEIGNRQLKGDLDTIILMALRKEPSRRYASVAEFSEDIRRHLAGLPVIARKATLSYKTSKFVGRNKLGIAVAAVVLLTLFGGIATTTWQARRANRRFNEVRKLAHAVLFDYHDAIADLPGSTPVRKRLVKDALEYLDSLARDAGSDVSLQREIASAYEKIGKIQGNDYYANLGDTAAALTSYRQSLDIRTKLAKNDPGNIEIQAELADSYEGVGDILNQSSDLKGSLLNYQQTLAIRKALVTRVPANTAYRNALAEIYTKIGDVQGMEGYPNLGDTAGALISHRESVALREEIMIAMPQNREARQELAFSLMSFGAISGVAGDVNAAATNGRRSVSLFESVSAEDPNNSTAQFNVLSAYAHLRTSLVDSGQLPEAIANDRKTIHNLEAMRTADPNNAQIRRSLGVSYNYLGRDLRASGDPAAAVLSHRQALKIAETNAAADPKNSDWQYDLAFTLQVFGEALADSGDYRRALENEHLAAGILESLVAAEPADAGKGDALATTYADIGTVLNKTGDLNGALNMVHQSISLAESATTKSPDSKKYKTHLAQRYYELGTVEAMLAKADPVTKSNAALLEGRRWLQKSFDLWQELRAAGKLSGADARKPDDVARAIATCDLALKR